MAISLASYITRNLKVQLKNNIIYIFTGLLVNFSQIHFYSEVVHMINIIHKLKLQIQNHISILCNELHIS